MSLADHRIFTIGHFEILLLSRRIKSRRLWELPKSNAGRIILTSDVSYYIIVMVMCLIRDYQLGSMSDMAQRILNNHRIFLIYTDVALRTVKLLHVINAFLRKNILTKLRNPAETKQHALMMIDISEAYEEPQTKAIYKEHMVLLRDFVIATNIEPPRHTIIQQLSIISLSFQPAIDDDFDQISYD